MVAPPPPPWTRWHTLLVALTAGFVWSVSYRPEFVESVCHEGQIVDLLTAVCYAMAAALFANAGRSHSGLASTCLWVLVLLCGFVAAEEVSWGQSLFHWQTPAAVERINVQGETNLHNLAGLHGVVRLAGLVVVVGIMFGVPWLARRSRDLGSRLNGLSASPSVATTTLLAIALMVGTRVIGGGPIFELDEWAECVLAFAFLEYGLDTNERRLQLSSRSTALEA